MAYFGVIVAVLGVIAANLPRTVVMDANTPNISVGSPCVLHEDGWDRYLLYFSANSAVVGGKMSNVGPTDPAAKGTCGDWGDRIWLTWSFGNGLNEWGGDDGWGNVPPFLLLSPGGAGESALIGDPAVAYWQGKWHMFYEGTDRCDGLQNTIRHAVADNWFGPWTKTGAVSGIVGHIASEGSGYSWPEILIEGSDLILYFQDEWQHIHAARATDSSGERFSSYPNTVFQYPGLTVSAGRVVKIAGGYLLHVNAGKNIYESFSTDRLSFTEKTPAVVHNTCSEVENAGVGDPFYLKVGGEDRLYFTGYGIRFCQTFPSCSILAVKK